MKKEYFSTIYKIIVPILCICIVSNLYQFNLLFCHLRSEKPPEQGKGSDFSYLGKYDPLLVEGWRPGQPNGNRGRGNQCLVSYLGLEPNASWYQLFISLTVTTSYVS